MIEIKHKVTGKVLYTHDGDSLRGADLGGANLRGAGGIIDAGCDVRGYRFIANSVKGKIWVYAGCRAFTLADARKHWQQRHTDNPKTHADCLSRITLIETLAPYLLEENSGLTGGDE